MATYGDLVRCAADSVKVEAADDEFFPVERFSETERHASSPAQLDRPHGGWQHPLLAPTDGPGPTYDRSEALAYVYARYERGVRLVGLSVRGLLVDEDRRALLRG